MKSRTFSVLLLTCIAAISPFVFAGTIFAQTTSTIVLQPAYDANNYNRVIYGVHPDINYPINEQVMLGFQNMETALIRFDVSGIPPNAVINSASLTLNIYGATDQFPFTIRRVLSAWVDSEVTYNHRTAAAGWVTPGASSFDNDISSTVLGTDVVSLGVHDIPLNAGEMQQMLTNNYGMWIHKDTVDNNYAEWYMMTDSTVSNRPKLTITYSVPLQGDANGDGKVDEADYAIWLAHFGQPTNLGVRVGDFNVDGFVDGMDYSIWVTHYSI
jgi:hypothetical protein